MERYITGTGLAITSVPKALSSRPVIEQVGLFVREHRDILIDNDRELRKDLTPVVVRIPRKTRIPGKPPREWPIEGYTERITIPTVSLIDPIFIRHEDKEDWFLSITDLPQFLAASAVPLEFNVRALSDEVHTPSIRVASRKFLMKIRKKSSIPGTYRGLVSSLQIKYGKYFDPRHSRFSHLKVKRFYGLMPSEGETSGRHNRFPENLDLLLDDPVNLVV